MILKFLITKLLNKADKKLKNVFKQALSKNNFNKQIKGNYKGRNNQAPKVAKNPLQYVLDAYNKVNDNQRDRLIDTMLKEAVKDNDFEKLKVEAHKKLTRQVYGYKQANGDKNFLDLFSKLFLKKENNKMTDWHRFKSSWLLKGKYSQKTRLLKTQMIRSGKIYTFYDVPPEVFLLLATAPAHAGKLAWRKNLLWRYSRGKYGKR